MLSLLAQNFPDGIEVTAPGRWLLVALAVALGGSLGSFLNVVVYRVPRGLSVNHPGSRCPKCEHPIRWYDNVPVVGWLRLGGRCRDCGAAISARYPLVEAALAVLAGLLAWQGLLVPAADSLDGETLFVLHWWEFLARLVVVWTLVCAALIEFDGQRVPRGLILVSTAIVLASLLSAGQAPTAIEAIGVALAITAGPWLVWSLPIKVKFFDPTTAMWELVLAGSVVEPLVTFGMVLILFAWTFAIFFGARNSGRTAPYRCGWSVALLLATLVVYLRTPVLDPVEYTTPEKAIGLTLGAAVATLFAVVMRYLMRDRNQPATNS